MRRRERNIARAKPGCAWRELWSSLPQFSTAFASTRPEHSGTTVPVKLNHSLGLVLLGCAMARGAGSEIAFAGVPVQLGGVTRANVPLSTHERSYASEAGNVVPTQAEATLAVPQNFDPTRSWPVLVIFSTSDFKRLNRDDLEQFYAPTTIAEGWVAIAGDAAGQPQRDTSGWRAGMTLAALDALHRSFPGSAKWPVACAGFSGGAKRAGLLAPLLSVAGNRVIGLFLSGMGEDRLSDGYRQFRPGAAFLGTKIFLSTGTQDSVATPQQQTAARASMQRTGFRTVRQEMFPGGHAIKRSHLVEALRWLRG